MILTLSPTYTQFDVIGWRSGSSPHNVCQHDCADDLNAGPDHKQYQGDGYLRDYLIGLIPSQFGIGAGLDVLHVSLHKVSDKYYLKFKTHVNDRSSRNGGTVPGRKDDYFGSCNVDWIVDDLMSKKSYESGNYQSLKWLLLPHADASQKNALLEVFSYYGIVGFRYFAAKWDGSKYSYSMVGVQPYNGQTSNTLGRGYYGTWGEGFMAMGTDQRFIDVNYYHMILGSDAQYGYWDSPSQDSKGAAPTQFDHKAVKRELDFVRGTPAYVTKLEK